VGTALVGRGANRFTDLVGVVVVEAVEGVKTLGPGDIGVDLVAGVCPT